MGLLVAGVHEGAAGALGAKIGVIDGGATLVGRESAGESGIGPEFWRASIKLAGMAEDDAGAAVHGLDHAADLDIHVAIFKKIADQVAIFPQADDGEAAGVVGRLRGAYIQEARTIGKLNDVVDAGGDADILIEHFGGFIGGDAGPGRHRQGVEGAAQNEEGEPRARAHRRGLQRMRGS